MTHRATSVVSRQSTNVKVKSLTFFIVDFADQDTPDDELAHCQIDWRGGLGPESGEALCDNSSYHVTIDDSLYSGVDDFIMTLSHQYTDDR